MRRPIQGDAGALFGTVNTRVIKDYIGDAATAMRWILHTDIVLSRPHLHCGFKSRPYGWNTGIDDEKITLAADTQNAFGTGTIHPAELKRLRS
jgi:hypothetical protein